LADGRQFVTGIEALDSAAKERGLTITSGASSVPALSTVVDRHLPEFERLRLHTDRNQLRCKGTRSGNRPRRVQLRWEAGKDSAKRVMVYSIRVAGA
jgi:hypothetical protein